MTNAQDPRLLSEERLREIFNTWRSGALKHDFCALESHIAAQAEIIATWKRTAEDAEAHLEDSKTHARAEALEKAAKRLLTCAGLSSNTGEATGYTQAAATIRALAEQEKRDGK